MKPGDHVIFLGASKDQIAWGSNEDPNKVLTVGDTYIIEQVEVHTMHTKVWLEDYGGPYNSVSFEPVRS